MKWCTHGPINTMKNWWSPIFMKIGQNDLENLYFLLIIKTYHFFIQFSFKIGFLCFVPSGNVQKKCTLHVPFSFMLNEKEGGHLDTNIYFLNFTFLTKKFNNGHLTSHGGVFKRLSVIYILDHLTDSKLSEILLPSHLT